jgi:hypothetical protein
MAKAAAYEGWTRETVLAADEATARGMLSTVHTLVEAKRKRDGKLVIAAAYAIRAAEGVGMDREMIVKRTGLKTSTVTLYRRLGNAVVDCGVEVGSEEWNLLSSRAGASIGYVSEVLDPKPVKHDDGTVTVDPIDAAEVLRRLDFVFEPLPEDGKGTRRKLTTADIAAKLNPAPVEDVAAGEGEPEDGVVPEVVGNPLSNETKVTVAIRDITTRLPELSEDEWKRLYPMLAALVGDIDGQVEAREAARKAGKRKAS